MIFPPEHRILPRSPRSSLALQLLILPALVCSVAGVGTQAASIQTLLVFRPAEQVTHSREGNSAQQSLSVLGAQTAVVLGSSELLACIPSSSIDSFPNLCVYRLYLKGFCYCSSPSEHGKASGVLKSEKL